MSLEITPELLIKAYAIGVFPMAEDATATELLWFDPLMRGVLPLDGLHIPRSLRKTVRQQVFDVSVDRDFDGLIRLCAESAPDRPRTWINAQILDLFGTLHRQGYAHSVEVRLEGQLVGGLYGVALGGAFYGESMVSRVADASKVALVHLVARLRAGGFTLLDTQFVTDHLSRLGAIEIPREEYKARLAEALRHRADFYCAGVEEELASLLTQSSTHTS
ncbi:leucyl/phenylalanyl-tRNA--protein transferase [Radicibacter daui]|uniref:leucyl/phenylalanyl-tRNA--protein transferase n=1 Tax=Radicibacter daui TaxID=3064829 RepID=UPI004046CAC2